MKAHLTFVVLALCVKVCLAQRHRPSGGSETSDDNPLIMTIMIPILISFAIIAGILMYCKSRCEKKRKAAAIPSSIIIASTEKADPYAPPAYIDLPPYAQPPPYEQPPSYRPPSATT